jgi:aspartate/methionine/tyrosine aminotransferase
MADRTAKVGSAGKIFSLTGWKVGWVAAPAEMVEAIAKAHQFVTFSTAPPLQSAVAFGLGKPIADVERTCADFAAARDRLREGLEAQGFAALPAEGTYFMSVDLAASGIAAGDVEFCERAVREAGVAAIPVSAFYAEEPVTNVIRLCFAKQPQTLEAGLERLGKARALFA